MGFDYNDLCAAADSGAYYERLRQERIRKREEADNFRPHYAAPETRPADPTEWVGETEMYTRKIASLKSKLSAANAKITKANAERDKAVAERERSLEQISSLQQQCMAGDFQLADAKRELIDQKKRYKALHEEMAQMRAENVTLQAQRDALLRHDVSANSSGLADGVENMSDRRDDQINDLCAMVNHLSHELRSVCEGGLDETRRQRVESLLQSADELVDSDKMPGMMFGKVVSLIDKDILEYSETNGVHIQPDMSASDEPEFGY